MDFLGIACQEPPINVETFGICDDANIGTAYTTINEPVNWIATVQNPRKISLVFTAEDNCIIKGDEHAGRGRCDGMLTSEEHLYFIELKDQRAAWQSNAIEQLESTIRFFIQHHPDKIKLYKHKKAFACNKRSPKFAVLSSGESKRFFSEYGFRLDVQAKVVVV